MKIAVYWTQFSKLWRDEEFITDGDHPKCLKD